MAVRRENDGRRRGLRAVGGVGALLACLALGVPATTASGGAVARIQIHGFRFTPAKVEVAAGATVTWVNDDEEIHTVTSTGDAFASPALDEGERFSYRFDVAGVYAYRCALHPHMMGTVVVR